MVYVVYVGSGANDTSDNARFRSLQIVDDPDETPPECVKRTVGLHVQCSTVDHLKNLLEYTRHSIRHDAATNHMARVR